MSDEDTTTTPVDDTTTSPEDTAASTPAEPTLPFEVPADLTTVSNDDLVALHATVKEHGASLAATSPAAPSVDTVAQLRVCRDLAVAISNVLVERANRTDEAGDLAAELAAADIVDLTGEPDPPEPAPTPTQPTQAVTAAARITRNPSVRQVAQGTTAPALPQDAQTPRYGSMTASSDIGGYRIGQAMPAFLDTGKALSARIDQYPQQPIPRRATFGDRRPVAIYDPEAPDRELVLRDYVRHPGVALRRDFPADQRVADGADGYPVAEHVASERRLPGGNLRESATLAVKAGRPLTAAAGWCAPSETLWDLVETETLDGILDTPEMQTSRGGWQIPINGGPDFATIYGLLGNAGDTHLSEAQVIADVQKICTEIPCPDFEEIRLGVDYYCITGGLLQRRGYPEVVARFTRAAAIALAHKINRGYIAAIVAGSGATNTLTADPSGDDAASALLSAVDLAIVDMKYRNRASFNGSMEVVLPWWVLVPIRAAMSRRTGVAMMDVTDAQILAWFTMRGAVPRFVYDWQDAFSGVTTGPGNATALKFLPSTVQMLVYPAGTWVKAVQDVVALDTIYDSTLLATNQYTAVFVEDGWAALKMLPLSRLYTVPIDPSGVTGCCPSLQS